jgi:hypothetical protein
MELASTGVEGRQPLELIGGMKGTWRRARNVGGGSTVETGGGSTPFYRGWMIGDASQ